MKLNEHAKEQIRTVLEKNSHLDWYHKFEVFLGSGLFTPGRVDVQGYQWRRNFVPLTTDSLAGKRVLDIGAYSGAFSFLLEDLGAEVVALDVYDPDMNGFNLVKQLRGSKIKHERMSIYDMNPEELGMFDIVSCYGVHYHLRHPILAFERCNSVCKDGGIFIGGGTGMDGWFHKDSDSCDQGVNLQAITRSLVGNDTLMNVDKLSELPLCGYAPKNFLKDATNWFIPTLSCLIGWVESCGFAVTDSHLNTVPINRDWNSQKKIKRTSLNFKAIKTGSPSKEYTWKHMKQFEIPTHSEVEKLRQENLKLRKIILNHGLELSLE